MRRIAVTAALIVGMVVVALFLFRGSPATTADGTEEDTGSSRTRSAKMAAQSRTETSDKPSDRVRLSLEAINGSGDRNRPLPLTDLARDQYYERLFVMKPRDLQHEEKLLLRLTEVFSEKPEVTLGEVACNADFCRVEIYGSAEADLLKAENAKALLTAVDARGLRFCIRDQNDTHTKAGCYFGRDDSWTVPRFAELGVMAAPEAARP